ncbi:MAG: hypothetical protein M3R43_04255 [Acidobacteriota bacterium]|nr:hypothetical protein [Acidobacteriota bacterium]
MDRVRFGRALGVGARAAAKSLMSAAEAAAAPAPTTPAAKPTARSASTISPAARSATTARMKPDARVVKAQARTLGRSVWKPLARFSSVLWLEVTGTFFTIFALIAGNQVWKWRAAVRLSPRASDAQRLYVYVVVFMVFGYFAVSSFVRANRRQGR